MVSVPASIPLYRPSGRFNLPGMLLTLAGSSAAGVGAALVFYFVSAVVGFGIPMLFPLLLGLIVGMVAQKLGSMVGHCRNQVVAVGVAVVAGAMAGSTEHVVDYGRFRIDGFNQVRVEAPYASSQEINRFIDQWLREETGQPGLVGFMLLEASEDAVEIMPLYSGFVIGNFRLTGALLMLYWLAELLVSSAVAGVSNRSYARQPYCEQCHVWRKAKVPLAGSTERIDEAVGALQRRDIAAAVEALSASEDGDVARLETEFCPACYDNSRTRLVAVRGAGEQTVWSDRLDAEAMRRLLTLTGTGS